jgi:hypothetical protein
LFAALEAIGQVLVDFRLFFGRQFACEQFLEIFLRKATHADIDLGENR